MLKKLKGIFKKIRRFFKKVNYKLNILFLVFAVSGLMIFPQHSLAYALDQGTNKNLEFQGIIVQNALSPILDANINNLQLNYRLPKIKDKELEVFNYRYITAYNVGVIAQTDNTPCIGASGDNLCQLVEQNINVCAANFVPLGTYLEIEGVGRCKVLDRMNARYISRVDIAMGPDEIVKAERFGLRYKKIGIY